MSEEKILDFILESLRWTKKRFQEYTYTEPSQKERNIEETDASIDYIERIKNDL